MGNFHCIPSDCATVYYREYLPPVVRWRYPGEEWNEKIALDFTIEDESKKYDLDPTKKYKITGKAIVSERVPPASSNLPAKYVAGQEIEVFLSGSYTAPIYKFEPVVVDKNINVNLTNIYQSGGNLKAKYCYKETKQWILKTKTDDGTAPRIKAIGGSYSEPAIDLNIGVYDLTFTEDGEALPCLNELKNGCEFTVFLDEQIVHQETRNVCPEVEQLGCQLDQQQKAVKIDKIPYLERVEVVPWAYRNLGYAVYQANIPDECLNIYNNTTVTIIPQFQGFPTPTNTVEAAYGFITQICSSPGCPPPEYTVVCDCNDCEECPSDTCPVTCDGHVCCYNTITGKSVKQIPVANYCRGIL